jgi:hypothetical protein
VSRDAIPWRCDLVVHPRPSSGISGVRARRRRQPRCASVLTAGTAYVMQEVKDNFQAHNMPLSCENVELRASLIFCMPYTSLLLRDAHPADPERMVHPPGTRPSELRCRSPHHGDRRSAGPHRRRSGHPNQPQLPADQRRHRAPGIRRDLVPDHHRPKKPGLRSPGDRQRIHRPGTPARQP